MFRRYLYHVITVRNKDNTWPEEMITLVKELKAKEKKQLTATQNNAVGQLNTIFTIVMLVATTYIIWRIFGLCVCVCMYVCVCVCVCVCVRVTSLCLR